MTRTFTRRYFLQSTALAASAFALSPRGILRAQAPSDRLNVAFVGVGGRGAGNLAAISECKANIVALCDVDQNHLAAAAAKFPGAKTYADFRKLLEQKDIDAVVVSTPDHFHAVTAIAAMRLGKHVYCEKPLTHSIYETRRLTESARKHKVATQMGNGGHSSEGTRLTVEWIQTGAIGPVREVHTWTNRAKGWWPQGVPRPSDTPPVPPTLNWDLWLGPAPLRPYHPAYHPFKWRGWADFGTGALGDMGCHVFDVSYWALNLTHPTTIEAETSGYNGETFPEWSIIRYTFAQRGNMPPVKLTWYDGGKLPPRPADLEPGREMGSPDGGTLFIGDKGTILTPLGGAPRLIPESKMKDFKRPDPFLPRSIGHHREWVEACKGGKPAGANFEYAGLLTEIVLLGNLAIRARKKIEWDGPHMKATNAPEADPLIHREYRNGWSL
ncbi:MAG: Gfo/Idh/MocA family protein [Bacillota bacterium]